MYIRTSPVEKIYVHVRGKNCPHEVAAKGDTLTEARFPLKGNEGYVRVTAKDSQSRFANSNAYFLDKYLAKQEEQ